MLVLLRLEKVSSQWLEGGADLDRFNLFLT